MRVQAKAGVAFPEILPALRLGYFLICIAVVGGTFAYGIALPLCLLGRVWRPAWKAGGRVLQMGVDLLLKLQPWLRADVEISLPARCVTVSNHRSHLDMFVLLSRIRNIRALAKAELFRVPFLGWMMRALRHIPIERGDQASFWNAMEVAQSAVTEGDPVHIFPEMTRCTPGLVGTQEFHLAPFRIAARSGAEIVPIVIAGTDDTWPRGVLGLYPGAITVRSLPAISPREYPSAEALRGEARRRIEEALSQAQRVTPR